MQPAGHGQLGEAIIQIILAVLMLLFAYGFIDRPRPDDFSRVYRLRRYAPFLKVAGLVCAVAGIGRLSVALRAY